MQTVALYLLYPIRLCGGCCANSLNRADAELTVLPISKLLTVLAPFGCGFDKSSLPLASFSCCLSLSRFSLGTLD